MDIPILGRPDPQRRVEVVRSFSYKLNVGNYESRDFFCSQKSECSEDDAREVSAALYAFCKQQVLAAVRDYINDMNAQRQRRQAGNVIPMPVDAQEREAV